jgi:fatty acid/phospholipid biosynthesis enzyme
LMGIAGNVVIAHGKSDKVAIASAIKLTYDLARTELLHELEKALNSYYGSHIKVEKQGG